MAWRHIICTANIFRGIDIWVWLHVARNFMLSCLSLFLWIRRSPSDHGPLGLNSHHAQKFVFFFFWAKIALDDLSSWKVTVSVPRRRGKHEWREKLCRDDVTIWCYVIDRQNMWRRYAVITTSRYRITSSHDIVAWSKVDLSRMMCKTTLGADSFRRDKYDDGEEQDDGFRLRLVLHS